MVGSVYGMINYYKLFSSPVKSNDVNPVSNLIYGNAASKVYSNTFAKKLKSEVTSYMDSIKSTASETKNTASILDPSKYSSTFNKKTVDSSNSSVSVGTASSNADTGSYSIQVKNLAKSQINQTSTFSSAEKNFDDGEYSFSVQMGNSNTSVSFSVTQEDNNKGILSKISSSINNSGIGITSQVISNEETGESFLQISSNDTGTKNGFSFADINGFAIDTLYANSISQEAEDTEYTVDGKEYTSSDNTVSVNNGKVSLTFLSESSEEVQIDVISDSEAIKEGILSFADSYNNQIENLTNYKYTFEGASKLQSELTSIFSKDSLNRYGISQNSDGSLSIDTEKLESSIKNDFGGLKSIFSDSGVADKLIEKNEEILKSPQNYLFNQSKNNYPVYNNPQFNQQLTTSQNKMSFMDLLI